MTETDDSSEERQAHDAARNVAGTEGAALDQALPRVGLKPQELIRYRDVPWHELSAARQNPVEYLKRNNVPVYVRIEEDVVALRYYHLAGEYSYLVSRRFEERLKLLRLDIKSLSRLAATGESSCQEFTAGGLAFVEDTDQAGSFVEQVDFECCFVFGDSKESIAMCLQGGESRDYFREAALKIRIREEDLWLLKWDEERIRADGVTVEAPEHYPYPPGLSHVPAVYWMFQAAYQLNVLKSIREGTDDKRAQNGDDRRLSVKEFLLTNAREVFSAKRAAEAAKFVKKGVHRRVGGSNERISDVITLGDLSEYLEPREAPNHDFISDGLRALMVIADWWADSPVNRKDGFPKDNPAQMARHLKSMGFGGTELSHLVTSINGGTKWDGKPIRLHGAA